MIKKIGSRAFGYLTLSLLDVPKNEYKKARVYKNIDYLHEIMLPKVLYSFGSGKGSKREKSLVQSGGSGSEPPDAKENFEI